MQTLSTGRHSNGDRSGRRCSTGLTLIELMVVMVLMVLLAGVTAPSLVAAHREGRIRAATRQVLARLRYARSRAVTSGVTTRFNVKQPDNPGQQSGPPPQTWISVLTTDSATGESKFEVETTPAGRPRSLPKGVSLDLNKEPTDQSTFSQPPFDEEEGVDYVTFWRNGQTVNALLVLTDDVSGQRIVRLHGVTGRAELVDEADLTDQERQWGNTRP